MNKNANLSIRVDLEVKKEAENILNYLGLSMSSAINMFLKQIVINRGLPFEVKIPNLPPFIEDLSQEELMNLLEEADNGKGISLEEFKKKYIGDIDL